MFWLKPKAWASALRFWAPRAMPSWAKAVSHDCGRVTVRVPPHDSWEPSGPFW